MQARTCGENQPTRQIGRMHISKGQRASAHTQRVSRSTGTVHVVRAVHVPNGLNIAKKSFVSVESRGLASVDARLQTQQRRQIQAGRPWQRCGNSNKATLLHPFPHSALIAYPPAHPTPPPIPQGVQPPTYLATQKKMMSYPVSRQAAG